MKVTIENYKKCGEKPNYLYSLLIDLAELNRLIEKANIINKELYIDYQDYHNTEYSPERTDPCPDYYGMYSLRFENDNIERVGEPMTLEDLDNVIYMFISFFEIEL
jgi:hypothetical protein